MKFFRAEILCESCLLTRLECRALGVDRDNRTLVDRNALTHGRECSQKLGAEEIKELKDQGKDTKDVMKALIEKSETFKQKTEFSQAKWLKKKAAKHAPQFTTARPSALTLCRAYFRKEPFKINHMREDTLARLLTLSNVQPGSRALVVDSMNGLVLGSLAERMGGMGRLMHGFNGLQPSVEALRWFNMDAARLGVIFHFPLSELAFVPRDKDAVKVVMGQAPAAEPAQANELGAMKQEGAHQAAGIGAAGATETGQVDDTGAGGGGEDAAIADARKRRIDASKRVTHSLRDTPAHAPTVEETQEELQRGFDSLVVAGSLDPKLLVSASYLRCILTIRGARPKARGPGVFFSPAYSGNLTCSTQSSWLVCVLRFIVFLVI